jgi:hypothetical protein
VRGVRRGGTLSIVCIIETITIHLATWLDAEVCKVSRALAVGTDNFASRAHLRSKGCGGQLETLFFAIANQILLMLNSPNNSVRGE